MVPSLSSFCNNTQPRRAERKTAGFGEEEAICVNRREGGAAKEIEPEEKRLIGDRMLCYSSVLLSVALTAQCPEAMPTDTLPFLLPAILSAFISQKHTSFLCLV